MDLSKTTEAYTTLTNLVKTDLNELWESKRIKGTEYADVYSALMNTCLQLAMDAPAKEAQTKLYDRQREGFDDDLRRKMLDIQMNSWAMMFSSGLLTDKPGVIANDEVSSLYNYMKNRVVNVS